ncbi:Asp-tRNA(Asn)/Glu-tRNA(Gln) amidotransferase subunit GatC [Candidatus Saccharibacteria bacterium]|nr:Asp-tRNA(Asn)/Glu-tRNA(Gln) amidotransferase subunit GatC [Candidatus Saccharibacteria bacterium]
MTQISDKDVRKLATLACLQIENSQLASLKSDLSNILSYVEKLSQLDTNGVEPTYQVTELRNVSRADEVQDTTVTRDDLLKLAPTVEGNSIRIPKVL